MNDFYDENEEQEQEQKNSHMSYSQYQKQTGKTKNEGLMIFVSAFFIMLLLFLAIAKQLSPSIDVSIGGNDSTQSEKETIDERLKSLQDADNEDIFSNELDEKVELPDKETLEKSKDKDAADLEAEKKKKAEAEKAKEAEQAKAATAKKEPPTPEELFKEKPVLNARVVVGYYSTEEQAQVAKGILQDSGLNVQPFIRSIGGAYTIQVGAFSSREKAQTLTSELLRNNYPARIIVE